MRSSEVRDVVLFQKLLDQRFFRHDKNNESLFMSHFLGYPEKTIVMKDDEEVGRMRRLVRDWTGKSPAHHRIISREDFESFSELFPSMLEEFV